MTILLEEGDSCRNITCIILPQKLPERRELFLREVDREMPLIGNTGSIDIFQSVSIAQLCEIKICQKLCFGHKKEYKYFRNECIDTLANLKNLEKFAIFHSRKSSSYYKHIAKLLQNHPKLVSLGNTDSSWAAYHIHTTCKLDTVLRFGLKECFWGFNSYVNKFSRREQIAYIQQYSKFVKSSVALFPLVEKLNIVVYHKNCLEHLKN
ncbi:hypothetical protein CEXT_159621 [Caerostris extrusa]|uniref:Uncharacterized protein n=1 Tax=Caerostris extrusa TaxID=172846 RepID=A0AAV4YBY5_CAEEX|nr:hypothetical protein CEXT_159621 [Caerostris extrusa]